MDIERAIDPATGERLIKIAVGPGMWLSLTEGGAAQLVAQLNYELARHEPRVASPSRRVTPKAHDWDKRWG